MIKTTIAVGLAALALTGCMTAQERADQDAANASLQASLERARKVAQVSCPDRVTCDRAWMLTRAYVEANSSMQIRNADDAAIDTFDPINTGMVSFYARRVPVKGGGMVITLDGVCRGMYQIDGTPGPAFLQCAKAVGFPQTQFGNYLQANLDPA